MKAYDVQREGLLNYLLLEMVYVIPVFGAAGLMVQKILQFKDRHSLLCFVPSRFAIITQEKPLNFTPSKRKRPCYRNRTQMNQMRRFRNSL